MPGNSWKDINTNNSQSKVNHTDKVLNIDSTIIKKAIPEKLSLLQKQRDKLQENMLKLSGSHSELSDRDQSRFKVQPFSVRKAELQDWANKHNTRRTTKSPVVGQYLADRDKVRDSERELTRKEKAEQRLKTVKLVRGSLQKTSTELKELDSTLKKEGLEKERNELKQLGMGRLQKTLDKTDKLAGKIKSPYNYDDSYTRIKKHQLDIYSGGSGDLDRRMERNRQRALRSRSEKSRLEQRDNERIERAKARRKGVDHVFK